MQASCAQRRAKTRPSRRMRKRTRVLLATKVEYVSTYYYYAYLLARVISMGGKEPASARYAAEARQKSQGSAAQHRAERAGRHLASSSQVLIRPPAHQQRQVAPGAAREPAPAFGTAFGSGHPTAVASARHVTYSAQHIHRQVSGAA